MKFVMDKQNTFKAVFFDFGGTLMDNESDKIAHHYMMKKIKEHYSLPATEEHLVSLYESQLFNPDMTIKDNYQRDNSLFKELHYYSEHAFKSMLEQFKIETGKSDINWFNEIYLSCHLKHVQLVEGVWDAILFVKNKGYHCGVISDIDNYYQTKQFEALNLNNAFNSITTSEETRTYKPEPYIFKIALSKAGYGGNECLMIGDSFTKDIIGGKKMGMTTIWINRYQNNSDKKDQADYIIEQFKDIIQIFKKIL